MGQRVNKRAVWIVGAILFVAMGLTLPVLYYMFVVGGVLTYAAVTTMLLPIFVHPFKAMHDGVAIFTGIHFLVYGALLFGISWILAKYLCRHHTKRRILELSAILVLLLGVSSLKMFGFFGHGHYEPQNAYGMWLKVWSEMHGLLMRKN